MKTDPTEEKTDALNELIVINNDRYEGYTKAAEQTNETDLKSLFTKFANESRSFGEELRRFVPNPEESPARDETRLSGKVYRAWMDIRKALSTNDRRAVLASCEYGEDVAKATYDKVLEDTHSISPEIVQVIRTQRAAVQHGHDTVKQLRDNVSK